MAEIEMDGDPLPVRPVQVRIDEKLAAEIRLDNWRIVHGQSPCSGFSKVTCPYQRSSAP
jgi:hypothetical protein